VGCSKLPCSLQQKGEDMTAVVGAECMWKRGRKNAKHWLLGQAADVLWKCLPW